MKKNLIWILIITATVAALTGCDTLSTSNGNIDALQASGIVEAIQVNIATELGGKVAEVYKNEGDAVEEGEKLFQLADDLLLARRDQAVAAQNTAESNLRLAETQLASAFAAKEAAEIGVEAAQLHLEQTISAARLQEQPLRDSAWNLPLPNEIDLPTWYFQKQEQIQAAANEVRAAAEARESARENYRTILEDKDMPDLIEAETRLAEAQAAFIIAQTLLDREVTANDEDEIQDLVQDLFDEAEIKLELAQADYNRLLSDEAAEDVLAARAELAVAQARFDLARDSAEALRTGEQSLAVQAARLGVRQAENAVAQADAAIKQGEAAIVLAQNAVAETQAIIAALDLQQEKLTVHASVSGVVLMRSIEPGEVLVPGVAAFTIGRLDDLSITVFVPENQYGRIALGDDVEVRVDSFSDIKFPAVVTQIADQAEFTPRNVQTQEERITTVYAIQMKVTDPDGRLKPGMPADVIFSHTD